MMRFESRQRRDTDVLFISERPLWPADQGFRIHGPQMARALRQRGLNVRMASLRRTPEKAPDWLRDMLVDWPTAAPRDIRQFKDTINDQWKRARRRLMAHQALDMREMAGAVALVEQWRPKVVIGLGQHAPVMLHGLRTSRVGGNDVMRIWYAADEPVSFQLSCLRRDPVRLWKRRMRLIGMYAMLQRLFASGLDGAIGVSPREASRLRWIGGVPNTTVIRNGVDLDYFAPRPRMPKPRSLIFWGNLSFEPNVDAACWFADHIWPELRQRYRGATWKIIGSSPCERVRELDGIAGIDVAGPVADIRPVARDATAVILPMRCGHGIKNKLLEAAAMGLPIVASRRAVKGLAGVDDAVRVCGGREAWLAAIGQVWESPADAAALGWRGREWVELRHDWSIAAEQLLAYVEGLRRDSDRTFSAMGQTPAGESPMLIDEPAGPRTPPLAWDDNESGDAYRGKAA